MSFHHIRATSKIKGLHAVSQKFAVSGIFRTGHPGVLLVSHPTDVNILEDCTKEIKSWRWASANVCGISPNLGVEWKHEGLAELDKMRDIVREAGEQGGEEVKEWVMRGLGLGRAP